MSRYVDNLGLWNVRPCEDGKPSGNDGWIITAYCEKIGVNKLYDYWDTFFKLQTYGRSIPVERLPGKPLPPPSRDMIIGMIELGVLHPWVLEANNWNFSSWELPKFNLFKCLWQFTQLIGKHRNFFWLNDNFQQVYRFAFSLPIQDRAWVIRKYGETMVVPDNKIPLLYRIAEFVDKHLPTSDPSEKLIKWLKYDKWPGSEVFEEYFGHDHPITIEAIRKEIPF